MLPCLDVCADRLSKHCYSLMSLQLVILYFLQICRLYLNVLPDWFRNTLMVWYKKVQFKFHAQLHFQSLEVDCVGLVTWLIDSNEVVVWAMSQPKLLMHGNIITTIEDIIQSVQDNECNQDNECRLHGLVRESFPFSIPVA